MGWFDDNFGSGFRASPGISPQGSYDSYDRGGGGRSDSDEEWGRRSGHSEDDSETEVEEDEEEGEDLEPRKLVPKKRVKATGDESELVVAARRGDVEAVKLALDQDEQVNACRRYEEGRIIDKELVRDYRTWYGETALLVAVLRGHEEVVRMLLVAGANPRLQGAIPPELPKSGSRAFPHSSKPWRVLDASEAAEEAVAEARRVLVSVRSGKDSLAVMSTKKKGVGGYGARVSHGDLADRWEVRHDATWHATAKTGNRAHKEATRVLANANEAERIAALVAAAAQRWEKKLSDKALYPSDTKSREDEEEQDGNRAPSVSDALADVAARSDVSEAEVNALLLSSCFCNAKYHVWEPILVTSAREGNLKMVSDLIDSMKDASPQSQAAAINATRMYRESQDKGFYSKEWTWHGNTALTVAVKGLHDGIVELLLAAGADPTLKGCDSDDVYESALEEGPAKRKRIEDELQKMQSGEDITSYYQCSIGARDALEKAARAERICALMDLAKPVWEDAQKAQKQAAQAEEAKDADASSSDWDSIHLASASQAHWTEIRARKPTLLQDLDALGAALKAVPPCAEVGDEAVEELERTMHPANLARTASHRGGYAQQHAAAMGVYYWMAPQHGAAQAQHRHHTARGGGHGSGHERRGHKRNRDVAPAPKATAPRAPLWSR